MTTDQNKVVVVTADSQDLIDGQFSSCDDTSTSEESLEAGGTLCEMEESGDEVAEEDTVVEVEDATPCDLCSQSPCDWIPFWRGYL